MCKCREELGSTAQLRFFSGEKETCAESPGLSLQKFCSNGASDSRLTSASPATEPQDGLSTSIGSPSIDCAADFPSSLAMALRLAVDKFRFCSSIEDIRQLGNLTVVQLCNFVCFFCMFDRLENFIANSGIDTFILACKFVKSKVVCTERDRARFSSGRSCRGLCYNLIMSEVYIIMGGNSPEVQQVLYLRRLRFGRTII